MSSCGHWPKRCSESKAVASPQGPATPGPVRPSMATKMGPSAPLLPKGCKKNRNPGTVRQTFISFKALFGSFKFCLQSRTGRSHYQHMTCQIRGATTGRVLIPHNSILWHAAGLIKASRFPDCDKQQSAWNTLQVRCSHSTPETHRKLIQQHR